MNTVLTLNDFCEQAGLPQAAVPELVETLQRRELVELARHEERMRRAGKHPRSEALPLRDENGEEWARVEARIPDTLFFNLMQRPGFGWEGLTHEDGIADILKDHPQCRVETVSGRISSGWTPGRRTVKKYAHESHE